MLIETEKTDFHVEVAHVSAVEKHPNADTLDLLTVNGYTAISRSGTYVAGDLVIYVPVDSMVPLAHPEFAFLAKPGDTKTSHRIKAMRLRGIFSMGLVIPAPPGVLEGQDVAVLLGVTKYESPQEKRQNAHAARNAHSSTARLARDQPKLPVYGLDNFRRYGSVLNYGEEVVVTEKIHGCNARFCFHKGRLWVGSHRVMRGASRSRFSEWLERAKLKLFSFLRIPHRAHTLQAAGDIWWEAAEQYALKKRLASTPDMVLYGEIYGEACQELKYDSPKGRKFLAFDVFDMRRGKFLDFTEFDAFITKLAVPEITAPQIQTVPLLYWGTWDAELHASMQKLADTGNSHLNSTQIIEGVVIKPAVERLDNRVGRVALKLVGEGYLLNKKS